jgi:Second Messenger Oligonucleotide or Dinucleotide Synthetase domain
MANSNFQTLPERFSEFDRLIRPSQATLEAARAAHLDVRSRISNDPYTAGIYVADFLQGSYARHTMVKPPVDDYGELTKADVDIILVTNVPETVRPEVVLSEVKAWLENEYGKGTAEVQSRSVKLTLPEVEVDLVPTSAPSEAQQADLRSYVEKSLQMEAAADPNDVLDPDEVFGPKWDNNSDARWREEPLRIPDIHAQCWQDTHPLATLDFTVEKNRSCDKKFLAVARALKWWRRRSSLTDGQKHPKSYPVEHMAGDHCPHGIQSVAEGLTHTFEGMRRAYAPYYQTSVPELRLRGLEYSEANVLSRLEQQDFDAFFEELDRAATIARNALTCADARQAATLWQELLGKEFKIPVFISGGAKAAGGYVAPAAVADKVVGGRFG